MIEQSKNKTIAKNTMFLYIRMMLTMLISLYTSRVVLQMLGVDDYGIYQAVGGIVTFLSFINNALSTGSSRFLTFELGTGNKEKLQRTFSTTLTIHILLALVIVIFAETLGLWFLNNKLNIDSSRLNAANFVFQFSIITAVFSITQIPYNASIIAHEKMKVFAYVSLVDVSLRLVVVYLLGIGNFDKLKFYAVLLCIVQISIMMFYRFYCSKKFKETKYLFIFDSKIFKSIAGFSGWSLFSGLSIALNNQGVLLILNMFFTPAIVAARSISLQVNMAANSFVDNFRTAVNPQIVKLYASKNYQESQKLLLSSTKYSYYLMWALCFPIFLLAKPILEIWLTEVPEYTVIFVKIIIIQSLFQVFDSSFYTALYAKGQLKENALISPTLGFIVFPIIYFLFKAGFSPIALSWATFILYAILGLIIKPILITKIAKYKWKDIIKVYKTCFLVTFLSFPIPLIFNFFIGIDNLFEILAQGIITILSIAISVYFIGLDKYTQNKIHDFVKSKINI